MVYAAEKYEMAANQLAYYTLSVADPGGRAVQAVGLLPLAFWDCGFEYRRGAWKFVSCDHPTL